MNFFFKCVGSGVELALEYRASIGAFNQVTFPLLFVINGLALNDFTVEHIIRVHYCNLPD
jgi:hypothetical protein